MKSCGGKINDLKNVEKVLRTLTFKFNHTGVTGEESKDISETHLEELQESLEDCGFTLKKRNSKKVIEQARQPNFFHKNEKQNAININMEEKEV